MALRGTDPESYITEYTYVYEDKLFHVVPWSLGSGSDQLTTAFERRGNNFKWSKESKPTHLRFEPTQSSGLVTSGAPCFEMEFCVEVSILCFEGSGFTVWGFRFGVSSLWLRV